MLFKFLIVIYNFITSLTAYLSMRLDSVNLIYDYLVLVFVGWLDLVCLVFIFVFYLFCNDLIIFCVLCTHYHMLYLAHILLA